MFHLDLRFRERRTPNPPLNKVVTGVTTKFSKPTMLVIEKKNRTYSGNSTPEVIEKCWDLVNPGPPYRSGGAFAKIKLVRPSFTLTNVGTRTTVPEFGPVMFQYQGGLEGLGFSGDSISDVIYGNAGFDPGSLLTFMPAVEPYCSSAYKRLRPHIEKASAFVMLREAKDIPRMIKTTANGFHDIWKGMGGDQKSALMQPKKAADHFLNHQFGWVPFLGDLGKLFSTYSKAQDHIQRLSKENGRFVKRKGTILDERSENPVSMTYNATPPWSGWPAGCQMELFCRSRVVNGNNCMSYSERRETFEKHVWAEGSFKYYRPEFDLSDPSYNGPMSTLQRHMTLYGLRISPSNVWKSTPWTWLADWFSNAGDHIDDITDWAQDGIVSRYMYLMCHYIRKLTVRSVIFWHDGESVIENSRVIESKQRNRACGQYGLSLDAALTPRQIAILGALKLSRRG